MAEPISLTNYRDPEFIEEAEERRQDLVSACQMIQVQLSNRKRMSHGRKLGATEYLAWRTQALAALTVKQEELHRIKRWIRNYHREGVRKIMADNRHGKRLLAAAQLHTSQLFDYVRELEDYARELAGENQVLREQLKEYELQILATR